MRYYNVEGYDKPLFLSEEHAETLGAKPVKDAAKPSTRASKAEWVAYGTTQGGDPSVLEQQTRANLIEQYGG